MQYRYVVVVNRKIIVNDTGDSIRNTRKFISDTFRFCRPEVRNQVSTWLANPTGHYLKLWFDEVGLTTNAKRKCPPGRHMVIITPYNTRAMRQRRQEELRKLMPNVRPA